MRFSYDGQSARNAGHRIDNFPFHEVEQECDILRSFGGCLASGIVSHFGV